MSASQPPVSTSDEHGSTKHAISDHETATSAETNVDGHQDNDLQVDLQADSKESEAANLALAMSMQASIVSMRSSLRESVDEHGRTYHKYKQGKYYMPNDKIEQDRLDLQHQLFYLCLDNKLHLAPITDPHNVLDIGTGTGIWAVDYALKNPSVSVLGIDLSAIQPAFVQPNCAFSVADAEDDWLFPHSFDFIHGRALFTCFKDPRTVFRKAYDALAPGGYFEMQDAWIKPHSHDGTLRNTNLERWYETLMRATAKLGRDWECAPKYAAWMREVGFEGVIERRLQWPQNTWPKGERNKVLGLWTLTNTLDAVVSVSTALLIRVLGMTTEEVEGLMEEVRRDMRDTGIHCYYPVYIVYGRKPL
jgi:SAM-dependent methyltransferase